MVLDPNDLPDEMDLASSEYLQSFEFRLRGREKAHLSKQINAKTKCVLEPCPILNPGSPESSM